MNNISTISELVLSYEKIQEKLKNTIIAIDIDGTIAKTVELFIAVLNKEYGTSISINDIFAWDTYFPSIKKGTKDIEDYFLNDKFIESIETYENSIEVINFITESMNPFSVNFVTSRPMQFNQNTRKWLDSINLARPIDRQFRGCNCNFTNTRSKGKENIIAHILIEDNFDNAYRFASKNASLHCLSMIPVRPWNTMYHTREIETSLKHFGINIVWFYLWEEVPELIFNYYLNE